ncbi:hypothetical protein [Methylococcus geothermalis]|uniref:Uncharacterized protein n=1 Tax=Methylococcus geothermalis TaxID=2681310 RepID=A0A858Q9R2_9GAMM|nr:hypothetical protein [Methylococcus geothermalis]QJD30563.1 hypothetical protein GNH96_11630 [Methylococcus geothermalis]
MSEGDDAPLRERQFYIDAMIDFAERVMTDGEGFGQAGFEGTAVDEDVLAEG